MEFANQFINTLDGRLSAPVKSHLKNVYSTLTATVLSASLGAYLQLYTDLSAVLGGWTQLLVTLGLILALAFTPDNGKNRNLRLGYLLGIGFFSGFSMGPLIQVTLIIDPKILSTALFSTAFIFGSLSLSGMFATRRQHLYLAAIAASGFSLLFWLAITNIFLNSLLAYKAYIYIYFALMCVLVVLDTTRIIDLRSRGDTDYIMHACMLFQDLIQIFRYLLVILTEKERSERNSKRKKN